MHLYRYLYLLPLSRESKQAVDVLAESKHGNAFEICSYGSVNVHITALLLFLKVTNHHFL